ncbi:hypothetical protein ACQEXU_10810 [Vibrio sp. TRT 21S02]|uniref:hypothetical protein n=1 Tax=Vibrio sp. TRT 21S02 TaxID=3418507 RepID=UPI003CF9B77D
MSETANQEKRKPRAPKSTAGADKEPVEKSAETQPTQTEQDALKAEKAKAKAEAEKQAKAEADAKAKEAKAKADAEAHKEGNSNENGEGETSSDGSITSDDSDGDALGILGAFKVRSKSDQGFWRSGVQFLRTKETVVLVVDEEPKDQPQILAQEGIEPELVLFMSKEKAKRVYDEPNLVVEDVELSDVIDIKDD